MSARILAAATALLVAGCGEQSEVYPLSVDQVRASLLKTALPFPLQGRDHAAMKNERLPDGTIELAIADYQGRAQLRFAAKLSEIAKDKTGVDISFIGAGPAYPKVEENIGAHPEIKAVYLKAVREQVDSQLDGRPFDNMAIGPEMMVAFAANAASIGRDMKAAGDEYRRRDRENIEKAYAAEGRGQW